MTTPKQVLFNTLEYLSATDLTRIGTLAGKAALDDLLYLTQNLSSATPENFCLSGMDMTPGVGLQCLISPGSLLRLDAGATADESLYELGRITAQQSVTLDAADGANDRIDLVYGVPTAVDSGSETRSVLTLPGRTVSAQSVNKVREAGLTLNKVTGTPGAIPAIPATPAGAVPLWYVVVPAGSVGPINTSDMIDSRKRVHLPGSSAVFSKVAGCLVGHTDFQNVKISSGSVLIRGVPVQNPFDLTYANLALLGSTGVEVIVANTEYNVWMIAAGVSPLGKGEPGGFTFVAVPSSTATVTQQGRPSAPITYRPNGSRNNIRFTTQDALYLGTLRSNESVAEWSVGGGSIPLSTSGVVQMDLINPTTGTLSGVDEGYFSTPRLKWVSSSQVALTQKTNFFMKGVPIWTNDEVATMPGDLVSGEVEQNSTWYYAYVRLAPTAGSLVLAKQRHGTLVLSSEAPSQRGRKPTPEAGYTSQDYLYVGSVFNSAAGNFLEFYRQGDTVLFVPRAPDLVTPPGGGQALETVGGNEIAVNTIEAFGTFVPKTTRIALVRVRARIVTAANPSSTVYVFPRTGNALLSANASYVLSPTSNALPIGAGDSVSGPIVISSNEQFEVGVEAATANVYVTVSQQGYVECVQLGHLV